MAKENAPSYSILIDGAEIEREHLDRVLGIRVEDCLGLPDVCTIELGFPRPKKREDPHEIDKQPFLIGATLVVKLGSNEHMGPTKLFEGEILTLEPKFGSGGIQLKVRAFDVSHRMHRARHTKTWQNSSASDIVSEVLTGNGLSAQTDSSGYVYKFMQQSNETDWDFINRLAERVGFELLVDGVNVTFRKPKTGDEVELEWGGKEDALISFNAKVSAVQQVQEVTLIAFDPLTKSAIDTNATSAELIDAIGITRESVMEHFGEHAVHVATAPVHHIDEGKQIAQSMLNRIANGYVAGEGIAAGNPKVKAGAKVKLTGIGQDFGGTYRVESSVHTLKGSSSYTTSFSSYPVATVTGGNGNSNGASPDFGAGLVLAEVTNNNDPESIGRVKVRYHSLGPDHEGWWARIATASAGAERGLLMLPQEGEEVLVGFEHGDTTRPYVLGSLFNGGKDKPGDELTEKKGDFVVLSDEKIVQRSKKDMIVSSGGKLEVEISGDVKETFSSKHTTEVSGNYETKVTGSHKLEVSGSVSIKGTGGVTVESSGTLDIKGNSVTIDGGPMLTLKGGMINIG